MAVVNTKSTAIANRDGPPFVLPPANLTRGDKYEAVGYVNKAAADSNGSVYRFARVRSTDRISSVIVISDAITGLTSVDLGLYATQANGGAVADADILAPGLSFASARSPGANVLAIAAADVEKRVWQLLGLAADPQVEYDVCLTANTAGSAAGNIAVRVEYCAGN